MVVFLWLCSCGGVCNLLCSTESYGCRNVLWGSVVDKWCGEVLQGRVGKKCCGEVLGRSVVKECCRELL